MLCINNFLFVILLHLIIATPQINLYFTNQENHIQNEEDADDMIKQNCLRVSAAIDQSNINRQIISYCLTESLTKYNIKQTTNHFPNFTFIQLAKQNISSQQLYIWSASIDLIEDYQEYLLTNDSSVGTKLFYNCTLPRFGPTCQYELTYYQSNSSSLYSIIHDYYHSFIDAPINMTCYTHLKCDYRLAPSSCLDWSEICDGKLDCSNDGIDEKYCWQLEINECNDDEYRCANGQCIPKPFHLDDSYTPDCLDQSDEDQKPTGLYAKGDPDEPSFGCEEIICKSATLTSSCFRQRAHLLINALFSVKNLAVNDTCWLAFKCISMSNEPIFDSMCKDLCQNGVCLTLIEQNCPDMLLIPAIPVLFNDIYFAYTKDDARYFFVGTNVPPYICYSNGHYDEYFMNKLSVQFNNLTCYRSNRSEIRAIEYPIWFHDYVTITYEQLKEYHPIINYDTRICNRTNMYQCIDSPKCISIDRILDGRQDCLRNDDEDMDQIHAPHHIEYIQQHAYQCQFSNKYIPQLFINDNKCDCGQLENHWCEDEDLEKNSIRRNISFQTICDGFTELYPILIDGQNHTDETECEQWLCNNIYTYCNGFLQCSNGDDEIGCYSLPSLNCSSDHHICVSPDTNQFKCLSIEYINNGYIDCIGGTDETNACQQTGMENKQFNFQCMHDKGRICTADYYLCDGKNDCRYGDDEQFCNKNRTVHINGSICYTMYSSLRTDVEQFLCENMKSKVKREMIYFSLDTNHNRTENSTEMIHDVDYSLKLSTIPQRQSYCHRGIDLQLFYDDHSDSKTTICLCPPSYYGNQCQYQNQRVSLSLQFQASSNSWQIPFIIIISLIDHYDDYRRLIHSYEQFTYLSARDCQMKFNVYLLYGTRSKNTSKTYSIHIDIYEKDSLDYRASLLLPVMFPFLPVHRLASIINIPPDNNTLDSCTNNECHHGKCLKYANRAENETFCQCDQGWSGKYCDIPHIHQCSSYSKYIGITNNNQSVCVCSLYRFGPRCYLINDVCSLNGSSPCQNNGRCIPNDEYIESKQKYTCICPKGYTGKHCEIAENKITILFRKDIQLPQSIFIHFIEVIKNEHPRRTTTFKTVSVSQNSLTVYWSQPFHIIFTEFPDNDYYLSFVEKNYNQLTSVNRTVLSSNRCRNITEIFNETIINLHPLRRIKYYQLPCQKQDLNLSCFYDNIHLCICQLHGKYRIANCFEFNHHMTFDCSGQSSCQNNGQCFQDKPNCPQRSICICPPCYYGRRCQFRSSGFRVSLDAILGYHIQPKISITKQPSIIQTSATLTCIFILVGLVNSILALMTFKNKTICNVGCGIYLLCVSIVALITICMFGLKFWILICTQMGLINNRTFLSFQCHSIDFILRIGLNMDQWLNACIAMERAYTVLKGTKFNKNKSKRLAKIVIILLFIIVIGTNIPDPIYRQLIDEETDDEKRIWCIVSYSSSLQTFNYIMTILHFILPFLCNLVSAIILIATKSRQKTHVQTHQNYNRHLREQIHEHKNLIISPIILVILALPHLIISFASKCMKSSNDSWLYIAGYFISFIPPMLTFVVFILPSKFFKGEFHKTMIRYRTNIQRHLRPAASL